MPSLFGMFVSSGFTFNVTRRLSWGTYFTFSKFLRESCVTLTYEGISLTIGKGGNQHILKHLRYDS